MSGYFETPNITELILPRNHHPRSACPSDDVPQHVPFERVNKPHPHPAGGEDRERGKYGRAPLHGYAEEQEASDALAAAEVLASFGTIAGVQAVTNSSFQPPFPSIPTLLPMTAMLSIEATKHTFK